MKKLSALMAAIIAICTLLTSCARNNDTISDTASEVELSDDIVITHVGEILTFGDYEWQVLNIQDGKASLITKDVINIRSYNDVYEKITWADCSLRAWLNNDFYGEFDASLQKKILETEIITPDNPWFRTDGGDNTTDRIFLLSIEEAVKYFGDSGTLTESNWDGFAYLDDEYNGARQAQLILSEANMSSSVNAIDKSPTYGGEYSRSEAIRLLDDVNGSPWWWRLRSPGENNYSVACVLNNGTIQVYGSSASNDYLDGDVYGDNIHAALGGVRPAMWIEASTDLADISASDEPEKPAPSETPIGPIDPDDYYGLGEIGFNLVEFIEDYGLNWQQNGPHGGIITKKGSNDPICYAEFGIDIVYFAVQKGDVLEVYSIFGYLREFRPADGVVNFGTTSNPDTYPCPEDNLYAFIQGIEWFVAGDYSTDPLLGYSHAMTTFHTFSIAPEGYIQTDYANRIMMRLIDADGNITEETIF
ncbi:MAG: DUF6273 domain-containing protein [Candidatus Saccharimonadales bacterium]